MKQNPYESPPAKRKGPRSGDQFSGLHSGARERERNLNLCCWFLGVCLVSAALVILTFVDGSREITNWSVALVAGSVVLVALGVFVLVFGPLVRRR